MSDEHARTAVKLYAAIHPACTHQLRWVISPAIRDAFLAYTGQTRAEWEPLASVFHPQRVPDTPETILGLPVRSDEHATTIMLELR